MQASQHPLCRQAVCLSHAVSAYIGKGKDTAVNGSAVLQPTVIHTTLATDKPAPLLGSHVGVMLKLSPLLHSLLNFRNFYKSPY